MKTLVGSVIAAALLGALVIAPGPTRANPAVAAGPAPSGLAVLSAMGDSITVVTHEPTVGSRIDRNARESIALPGAGFDKLATATVAEAMARIESLAARKLTLLAPSMASEPGRWVQGQATLPSEGLRAQLMDMGASQLLIISPHRAPSALRTAQSSVGSGYLQGLGFYIDRQMYLRRSDTGESGRGMLAPFVYLKIELIDLATAQVVATQSTTASTSYSGARSADGNDAWAALDARQKVNALSRILRTELHRMIPALTKSLPPAN